MLCVNLNLFSSFHHADEYCTMLCTSFVVSGFRIFFCEYCARQKNDNLRNEYCQKLWNFFCFWVQKFLVSTEIFSTFHHANEWLYSALLFSFSADELFCFQISELSNAKYIVWESCWWMNICHPAQMLCANLKFFLFSPCWRNFPMLEGILAFLVARGGNNWNEGFCLLHLYTTHKLYNFMSTYILMNTLKFG